jgi:hypothetical protein
MNERKLIIFSKIPVEIKVNKKKRKNFHSGFHIFKQKAINQISFGKTYNFVDFDFNLSFNPCKSRFSSH